MTTFKKRYGELLSLTQLFLLREHALADIKIVDPVVWAFFREKMKAYAPVVPARKMEALSAPLQPIPFNQNTRLAAPSIPPPSSPEPKREPLLSPPKPPEPPSPAPRPPEIQQPQRESKKFALEPFAPPQAVPFDRELWQFFSKLFPGIPLSESLPSDSIAKKLKNTWLNEQVIPSVIILSFHGEEKHLSFLKNLAQAISLRLAPARVLFAPKLEKENGWENILNSPQLRLIIAGDYGVYLQPGLMRFYREIPQQSKHFLNHIPLLLLSDLSLYFKEPQLKSLLWRAICNEFATLQR